MKALQIFVAAFNDTKDETVWKLQQMGIKFIDRKNPISPSGSVVPFPDRSDDTARQTPATEDSPRQGGVTGEDQKHHKTDC